MIGMEESGKKFKDVMISAVIEAEHSLILSYNKRGDHS